MKKLEDIQAIEIETTNVSIQQKCKYILHWTWLIFVHAMIFWYYPISGNISLYETAECPPEAPYGCRSFAENSSLIKFYFLYCIYFYYSSLQIRYGLPT